MLLPERKSKVQRRLKVIQGQVGGIPRLVESESYCLDILTQIAAIQEALRGVSKEIVRNHLETCVADPIKKRSGEELTDIMFKLSR